MTEHNTSHRASRTASVNRMFPSNKTKSLYIHVSGLAGMFAGIWSQKYWKMFDLDLMIMLD